MKINIKDLEFTIEQTDDGFELECPKLEVYESGKYVDIVIGKFSESLYHLWDDYVLEENDNLTTDAIEFKELIKSMINIEK